jgi:hypothetical protein
MTVRLTRSAHGRRPQSSGIEIDDDGLATGWSTCGNQVGRFARQLRADERESVARALAVAQSAGGADGAAPAAPEAADEPRRPSGVTEELVADGLPELDLGGSSTPALTALIALLRALRDELGASPVAAIELEVAGRPLGARLRHVGVDPIRVRGATLSVRATTFDRDSAIVDSAILTVDGPAVDGTIEAGWQWRLTDDLGVRLAPRGGFLTVTVGILEVDSLGDGVLRPAEFSWMSQ